MQSFFKILCWLTNSNLTNSCTGAGAFGVIVLLAPLYYPVRKDTKTTIDDMIASSMVVSFFVLFLAVADGGFDFVFHIDQHCQGFLVIGKQPSQQENGDGHGKQFFRRERKPQKGQICAGDGDHPLNLQPGAETEQNIRPAVGDHPADTQTEQKPGIEKEIYGFF